MNSDPEFVGEGGSQRQQLVAAPLGRRRREHKTKPRSAPANPLCNFPGGKSDCFGGNRRGYHSLIVGRLVPKGMGEDAPEAYIDNGFASRVDLVQGITGMGGEHVENCGHPMTDKFDSSRAVNEMDFFGGKINQIIERESSG